MEEERDVGIRLWEEISEHLRDEKEMVVVDPDLYTITSSAIDRKEEYGDTHEISFLVDFSNFLCVRPVGFDVSVPAAFLRLLVERIGERKVVKDRPEVRLAHSAVEVYST